MTAIGVLNWGHINANGFETLALLATFTTASQKAVLNPATVEANEWETLGLILGFFP
jgi:hypothetical protein